MVFCKSIWLLEQNSFKWKVQKREKTQLDLFPISVIIVFINKCNMLHLSMLAKIALCYILTSDAHGSICNLNRQVSVAVLESSSYILVVYGLST